MDLWCALEGEMRSGGRNGPQVRTKKRRKLSITSNNTSVGTLREKESTLVATRYTQFGLYRGWNASTG